MNHTLNQCLGVNLLSACREIKYDQANVFDIKSRMIQQATNKAFHRVDMKEKLKGEQLADFSEKSFLTIKNTFQAGYRSDRTMRTISRILIGDLLLGSRLDCWK